MHIHVMVHCSAGKTELIFLLIFYLLYICFKRHLKLVLYIYITVHAHIHTHTQNMQAQTITDEM